MSVPEVAPSATGTTASGKIVVNLDGCFRRTGAVEVELGTKLSQIVNEVAGGAREGCTLKAIQVGGPCGALVPISNLEVPLDANAVTIADCKVIGPSIHALDTTECVVDFARRASVAAHELVCGQCTFGREGTRQLADVLTDLANGRGSLEDLELLRRVGEAMKRGSLCSNGTNAPYVVLSAMEHFRAEFEAHADAKQCPMKVCAVGREQK